MVGGVPVLHLVHYRHACWRMVRAFAAIVAVQLCFIVVVILRIDGLSSAVAVAGLPIPGAFIDPVRPHKSVSTSLPSCLFVISTSAANEQNILEQFHTYRDDPTVDLWVNIYDGYTNNSIPPIPPSITTIATRNGSSTSFLRSEISGLKPTLWEQVGPRHTSNYDYLYFLDDDMLFDRNVFAFDQFRWLVHRVDAVIASPKIIRNSAPGSERKAAASRRGGATAGKISVEGGKTTLIRGGGGGGGGGGNILRTNTIKMKRRRRRLTSSQDGSGWALNPLGLYKEESTADRLAAKVKVVEIGSFMIKTKAWHFFQDNMFIPSSTSDCGPDCVWCRVFEKEGTRFGEVPCLRTLHIGIHHLDTKSYTGSRSFAEHNAQCVAAVEAYFVKAREKYAMEKLGILQCRDKSVDYVSLSDILREDHKIL